MHRRRQASRRSDRCWNCSRMRRPLPPRIAIHELAELGVRLIMDQFAKPDILPPDSKRLHASKRAWQSRATFVAASTCVLVAAAHPGAGAVLQTAHICVVANARPRQMRSTAQMNTYAGCAARHGARLACVRCRRAQGARRHRAGDVDLGDSHSPMLSEAVAVRAMQCIVNRGGSLMLQSSRNTRARTRPVVLGALLGSRMTFITSMPWAGSTPGIGSRSSSTIRVGRGP